MRGLAQSLLPAFFLLTYTLNANAEELVGFAGYTQDGDTFELCSETGCSKIRICGIDAPENGQKGFHESAIALTNLIQHKPVRCVKVGDGTVCDGRSKGKNRDRIIAQCFVGGRDIAEIMVQQGFACDKTRYSAGHYSERGNGIQCK